MSELADSAKQYWATHHNQSVRVPLQGHEYRYDIANYILDTHAPSSVFEFGCSSGRNLAVLRELARKRDIKLGLYGIDANKTTVDAGHNAHADNFISIKYGDEVTLSIIPDNSYDVVLSVSVLDHIPNPQWCAVYDDMVRVASKAVVMVEPVVWETAYKFNMLERDLAGDTSLDAPDFTWAHDYEGHDSKLKVVRAMPLGLGGPWQKFGQLYVLMERVTE